MSGVSRFRDKAWPWSVLFWCTVPFSLYAALFALTDEWWWTAVVTAVAVVALGAWAVRYPEISMGRTRQIWRWTSAVVLAVCALGLFVIAGREVLGDKSSRVGDSSDPRRVACGSVLNPRPNDMLTADFPEDFPVEAREQLGPISTDSLATRCYERLDTSSNFGIATALGAAQLAVRAMVHLRRRKYQDRAAVDGKDRQSPDVDQR
ncbi:hypothetical protein CH306_11585 [Rhodococcus sp. 15-725-2-2b]|uniref:hypothetical protein n=1 Tax=unclassified Rhodococcus (in: high G+C Gram-positive bacteria) TaxID=192944 RepID=UPI000B9B4AD0|nr:MULTISPECIES: hypothetical protein [unclassified Rhodococcus (in: high G+C Gram-positive bacteria)]OZE73501.1 hypothetical protein CH306_11585 [Rhodococcus sp. 15-725-2-2b]